MFCPLCNLKDKKQHELEVDVAYEDKNGVVRLLCNHCGYWVGIAVKYKKDIAKAKKDLMYELKDRDIR